MSKFLRLWMNATVGHPSRLGSLWLGIFFFVLPFSLLVVLAIYVLTYVLASVVS